MDIALTETDRLLAQTAKQMLSKACSPEKLRESEESASGHDERLWQTMCELGWMEIPSAESADDAFLHLAVVLGEMGAAALASPFFQTVAAGGILLREVGEAAAAERLARDIAVGSARVSLVAPADMRRLPRADVHGDELVVRSGRWVVEWAHVADLLILPICIGNDKFVVAAADVDAPGVTVKSAASMDNERVGVLELTGLRIRPKDRLSAGALNAGRLDRVLALVKLFRCAEMVGGTRRVVEMTVDYMKVRHQFGRPLGTFQAVQHTCADMAMQADAAYLATYEAISRAGCGVEYQRQAAMATFITGRAYERVTQLGAQLHGALGTMQDYELQYFYRRAKAQRLRLGSAHRQLEAVASSLSDSTWWYDDRDLIE